MRTAQPFIPFIRANHDLDHLESFYSDAPACRVTLNHLKWIKALCGKHRIWIDLALDGVGQKNLGGDYERYINRHGDSSFLNDDNFLRSPKRSVIESQIVSYLSEALALDPYAISIPQLPQTDGTETNKVNKLLYKITSDFRTSTASTTKLILPVIFSNQRQLNKKTARNSKLAFIKSILAIPGADGIWATDYSLEDQAGTGNFDKERFPGVIDFFKELGAMSEMKPVICGPFWGLGIVLWCRGLCSHFGIGLGSAYRYYLPGGISHKPKSRIAIAALRRWVSANPPLEDWLIESIKLLPAESIEAIELRGILKSFAPLLSSETARRQVARTYRSWIDKIAATPAPGRNVALFQDLTAAFVTGKGLPDLPDEPGLARRPERVAEQLMLNCL